MMEAFIATVAIIALVYVIYLEVGYQLSKRRRR